MIYELFQAIKKLWKELAGTGTTLLFSAISFVDTAAHLLPFVSSLLGFVCGVYSLHLIRAKLKTEHLRHKKLEDDEEESE